MEEPTQAAWQSLTQLTTALAREYQIDPYITQNYFRVAEEDPFLEVHQHKSIVGHKDTKSTACPGTHVYNRMPHFRARIK